MYKKINFLIEILWRRFPYNTKMADVIYLYTFEYVQIILNIVSCLCTIMVFEDWSYT